MTTRMAINAGGVCNAGAGSYAKMTVEQLRQIVRAAVRADDGDKQGPMSLAQAIEWVNRRYESNLTENDFADLAAQSRAPSWGSVADRLHTVLNGLVELRDALGGRTRTDDYVVRRAAAIARDRDEARQRREAYNDANNAKPRGRVCAVPSPWLDTGDNEADRIDETDDTDEADNARDTGPQYAEPESSYPLVPGGQPLPTPPFSWGRRQGDGESQSPTRRVRLFAEPTPWDVRNLDTLERTTPDSKNPLADPRGDYKLERKRRVTELTRMIREARKAAMSGADGERWDKAYAEYSAELQLLLDEERRERLLDQKV